MRKIFAIVAALTFFILGVVSTHAQSQNEFTNEEIENIAIKFATTSFSDFVGTEKYCDELISTKAIALKNFISDKREINKFKQQLFGRKLSLVSQNVIECESENLESNLSKVLLEIHYTFMDGNLESNITVGYKIYISATDGKIVAAMTNDLSAGTLISSTIGCKTEDLNAEYQLESDNNLSERTVDSNIPYDLATIKDDLTDYFVGVQSENVSDKSQSNDFQVTPRATFVSFTSTNRANMRTYQDKYYNTYNSSYANFDELGGDCTNYASQVLYAGGAPQYVYSKSGISGSDYWYYKDSSNRSSSWAGVNQLRSFLLNNKTKGPSGSISSTFSALESGDIIQLGSNDNYTHSIVVYTQGDDPWVTAHSNAYSGRYASRYGGKPNSKIHISGYYK